MNVLKGIGAILAGMIFIVVSHTGTDFVLESLGIFTQPNEGFHTTWMVVTATIYRSIYTVAGGYITAALAPDPQNAICSDSRNNRCCGRYTRCNSNDTDGNSPHLVSDRAGRTCPALCVVGRKVEN